MILSITPLSLHLVKLKAYLNSSVQKKKKKMWRYCHHKFFGSDSQDMFIEAINHLFPVSQPTLDIKICWPKKMHIWKTFIRFIIPIFPTSHKSILQCNFQCYWKANSLLEPHKINIHPVSLNNKKVPYLPTNQNNFIRVWIWETKVKMEILLDTQTYTTDNIRNSKTKAKFTPAPPPLDKHEGTQLQRKLESSKENHYIIRDISL